MYQKSKEKSLSRELFQNPTNEYRGAPFWAWNQALSPEVLVRHIDYFKEMGIGGFHMHCRTGLDTPYMGEEYKECVRACVDKAKAEGMYAYLYDEDRWPSGAAGGKVTKDVEYRSRYLVFTPVSNEDRQNKDLGFDSSSKAAVQGNGTLLARYDITLENGCLKEYRRLADGEQGENIWFLYEEIARESPWYNNETYVDTLNPKAIERFIEETHEQYLGCVGEEFGKTVPSIFTDEPQFSHKTTLSFAESGEDVILPYTDSLPEGYKAAYGEDFFDTIPELIWELPEEKVSAPRYHYHDFVAEQFGEDLKVAIVEGLPSDHTTERMGGFVDKAAEKYPNIKVVASQAGDWEREKGMNAAANMLQANKDIDVIFALCDEMGLGAVQAVKEAGSDAKVVSFDGNPNAVASIQAGELVSTVSIGGPGTGVACVEALDTLFKGETVEKIVNVETEIVWKDNADQFPSEAD